MGLDGFVFPGGPFTIGPITISGGLQSASVTGMGLLHITDGLSLDLTGTINWVSLLAGVTGRISSQQFAASQRKW